MRRDLTSCVVMGFGLLAGLPAMGADPKGEVKKAKTEVYEMWNVPSMIRQASDNVARRYNLNKEQAERTREKMEEGVTRFLEENEEAIWPLVRDLARQQLTGKMFDPSNPDDLAAAKRIGEAALPIVEKARQAIYQGNADWRTILSPEQKQLHDYDLQEMKGTFEEITKNFEKYKAGDPVPNPMFPQYEPKPNEPPRPPRPPSVITPGKQRQEDTWERYVQDFIRKYQLDPPQREAAESILREMKQRAADHRASKAKDYEEVRKRLNESFAAGADLKKRAAASRDEKQLNKPIDELFDELKGRLDKIPTAAQKKKYEDGVAAKRTRTRPTPTSRPTTRPADGPTSQPAAPATTRPAEEKGSAPTNR
ncbi:MAG: hypothetical protein V2A79_15225 [Planctomycetota bacterium]